MMATSYSKPTLSRRAGRAARRVWRWLVQRDSQFNEWVAAFVPSRETALLVSWCVKFVILGLAIYVAFGVALLIATSLALIWVVSKSELETPSKPEWRDGHSGYGFYDKNEWRHDMGDTGEDS
ncbi:DUF3742 family protein [Xanthomonas sp. NCPPB 1067]|uniref:DUF3742 family protein n=1 Tax=Xanthomonas sp. NCPPB 1067 TaxID=487524 RepID=UPI001E3BD7D1|nr:DUF3742 family protein [Xanthomonas sp. NCPPB 1067]MCC4586537.1 DUF3742 family protein [Xanthomonas sp. NCPPB 1067]